jgi:hypothetical protein
MEIRVCRKCHEAKPLDAYYRKMSGKYAGYVQTYCKACHSKRAVAYYVERKEQRREIQRKWYHERIKTDPHISVRQKMRKWEIKLGLPRGWYAAQFERQNGLCAICGQPESTKGTRKHYDVNGKRLAIDHCHDTNTARGLLCMGCNTKLAIIEDADFTAKAEAYLQKYQ